MTGLQHNSADRGKPPCGVDGVRQPCGAAWPADAVPPGPRPTKRLHIGSAAGAALINFIVGTVALTVALLAMRDPIPTTAQLGGLPWWGWLAGLAGASYVAGSAVIGPMIGGATFIALIVAGQMTGALTLDHFGALGFPERPVTAVRLAGVACVVIGVVLLSRK